MKKVFTVRLNKDKPFLNAPNWESALHDLQVDAISKLLRYLLKIRKEGRDRHCLLIFNTIHCVSRCDLAISAGSPTLSWSYHQKFFHLFGAHQLTQYSRFVSKKFSGENTTGPPEVPLKNILKTVDGIYIFKIFLQNLKRISIYSIFSVLLGMEGGSVTKLFRNLPVVTCEKVHFMAQENVIPSKPSSVQAFFLNVYNIFLFKIMLIIFNIICAFILRKECC